MTEEYTGKKVVNSSDFPKPANWIQDETRYNDALQHLTELSKLTTEVYADLLDIIFSDKFTLQHAILLSVLLRRMDCCELEPFEISCL